MVQGHKSPRSVYHVSKKVTLSVAGLSAKETIRCLGRLRFGVKQLWKKFPKFFEGIPLPELSTKVIEEHRTTVVESLQAIAAKAGRSTVLKDREQVTVQRRLMALVRILTGTYNQCVRSGCRNPIGYETLRSNPSQTTCGRCAPAHQHSGRRIYPTVPEFSLVPASA